VDVDVFVCAGAGANAKGVDLVKDRKSFAESKVKERIVYSANFWDSDLRTTSLYYVHRCRAGLRFETRVHRTRATDAS
jgi:hypothetical protein